MEQIFEQTSNPRRKSGLTHFTFDDTLLLGAFVGVFYFRALRIN